MTHVVVSVPAASLKVFDSATGAERFQCAAYNNTVNDGYGHFGHCPPGEYKLGEIFTNTPTSDEYPAEGAHFISINDVNGLWRAELRSEIGIHAGRGNAKALTEGCIRISDSDLAQLVKIVNEDDDLTVIQ